MSKLSNRAFLDPTSSPSCFSSFHAPSPPKVVSRNILTAKGKQESDIVAELTCLYVSFTKVRVLQMSRDPRRQCRECPHAPPSIPSHSLSALPFSLHGARDKLVRGRKLSQCSTKWPRLMRSADSQPARRRASQAVKRPHLGHARAQTTDADGLTSPWPRPRQM